MPETIFLTERTPLVVKVADWLIGSAPGRPIDLSGFLVVVPTAGAARRLRAELVRRAESLGTGLLSPRVTSPMETLNHGDHASPAATRADMQLAWSDIIARASSQRYPILLGGFADVRKSAFRIAQSLIEVCSLLAEAGLTPSSPEIFANTSLDEDRWREIENLYRRYLQRLERAGVEDANECRIRGAENGQPPPGIEKIIVAGVPDLNRLVQRYLENLSVPVTVLVDAPECEDAEFDSWGRPGLEYWQEQILPIQDILSMGDSASEATTVARTLGPAALCVADGALLPHLRRAFLAEGREAFDPGGKPLERFECAAVSRLWISFCRTQRMANLRSLAEHPAFLQALAAEAKLTPDEVLKAIDRIRMVYLVDFLPEAVAREVDESAELRDQQASRAAVRLAKTVEIWRQTFDCARSLKSLPAFLEKLYAGKFVPRYSPEADALAALAKVFRTLLDSPVGETPDAEDVLNAEIQSSAVYGTHDEKAVELNGWLEAAWLPHDSMVVCGCTEGVLPSQVDGHAFLPDSLRVQLGITGNSARLARDIYLMHCLLVSRAPGAVRLTLSRVGDEGEPSKPSRLLFRCPDRELPGRVRKLFGEAPTLRIARPRQRSWDLNVPMCPPPERLRVTAFGDYLDCPLRFYFKHVLKMDGFDARKAEMDALDFGIMLHLAVEAFSCNEGIRDSTNPVEIERFVHGALDEGLERAFGQKLSLPVQVQRESLRARLRRFAHLQAEERQKGWRIVGAEIEFKVGDTLELAGLPITAKIDRVERHEITGQRRILDYKTYKTALNHRPEETHLGKADEADALSEAEYTWGGKPRRWRQLQLPLYRAMANYRWADEPEPVITGYFLLPEKLEESGIHDFPQDDKLFESAMNCAAAVAERVRQGVFWPPREVTYEAFEQIFLGEQPDKLLSQEAVEFLKGKTVKTLEGEADGEEVFSEP